MPQKQSFSKVFLAFSFLIKLQNFSSLFWFFFALHFTISLGMQISTFKQLKKSPILKAQKERMDRQPLNTFLLGIC